MEVNYLLAFERTKEILRQGWVQGVYCRSKAKSGQGFVYNFFDLIQSPKFDVKQYDFCLNGAMMVALLEQCLAKEYDLEYE